MTDDRRGRRTKIHEGSTEAGFTGFASVCRGLVFGDRVFIQRKGGQRTAGAGGAAGDPRSIFQHLVHGRPIDGLEYTSLDRSGSTLNRAGAHRCGHLPLYGR
jgi:hypothetical protein